MPGDKENKMPESVSYRLMPVRVLDVVPLTSTESLLSLRRADDVPLGHSPGQFVQASLPGMGEAPISICSSPTVSDRFELCVRKAGDLTGALCRLTAGDTLGIRGPYGSGVGAVEAPRGLLLHEYWFNNQGICMDANQVIPTGQNLGNIEADMHGVVSAMLDQPEDLIRQRMEMLVRAYDPCISCSTHTLQVTFT